VYRGLSIWNRGSTYFFKYIFKHSWILQNWQGSVCHYLWFEIKEVFMSFMRMYGLSLSPYPWFEIKKDTHEFYKSIWDQFAILFFYLKKIVLTRCMGLVWALFFNWYKKTLMNCKNHMDLVCYFIFVSM
jgi:hypothetical protein